MIRALADVGMAGQEVEPGGRPSEAVLYCNVGDVTNLAVARGRSCLFTRVSHAGLESIGERLAGARGLSAEHAAQWLSYVGLEQPLEALEGDPEIVAEARAALEEGVGVLLDELRLSLDYYGAQEGALPVSRIVLGGQAGTIPGLAARMEEGLGRAIAVARPAALAGLRRAHGRPPHPFLRPGPGELSDASGQPDPPRAAPRRQRPAALRPAPLHRPRRPCP